VPKLVSRPLNWPSRSLGCMAIFADQACAVPQLAHWPLSWCFLCLSGCSAVLADQALDDVGARDAGGHLGRLAGFVPRRSLVPRLVRPMLVVVPRVLGQDPPEVSFAVGQQVVGALAP
jgi:hypothetical protein